MTVGAKNRLIHDLIDKSNNRLVQVRAGFPLFKALQHDTLLQEPHVQLPQILGAKSHHETSNVPIKQPQDHRDRRRRKRAINFSQSHLSSSTQYEQYVGSKLPSNLDSMHILDRRYITAKPTMELNKLVAKVSKEEEAQRAQHRNVHESAKVKFMRAIALLNTGNAFRNVKALPALHTEHVHEKNAHLAFMEFRKEAENAPHPQQNTEINVAVRSPLRFGDQVCFISSVSCLPLAIGRDGRTMIVDSTKTGPHMMFTIVDFLQPMRRDDVLMGEDFWLRINSSILEDSHVDDYLDLLVNTQYYLACPGWIEDEIKKVVHHELPQLTRNVANKYKKEVREVDTFKVIAMKARVPSNDYYGDDDATREYAAETNPNIMRLAKWNFSAHANSSSSFDTKLVLNCSNICLKQSDFALEYDTNRHRGVLRGIQRSIDEIECEKGPEVRPAASWQIRLVQRSEGYVPIQSTSKPKRIVMSLEEQQRQNENRALEWLKEHSDQVKNRDLVIEKQQALVSRIKCAYDQVAQHGNQKVAQIENEKASHEQEYFQALYAHGRHNHLNPQ